MTRGRSSSRAGRAATALALLAVALLAPVRGDSATRSTTGAASRPGTSCPDAVSVPGLGSACPTDTGLWRLVLPDGLELLTHGPDRYDIATPESTFLKSLKPLKPSCITDEASHYRLHVLYAKPLGSPDRYRTMAPAIRSMVYKANAMLNLEARELGASSMRYRMLCTKGEARVSRVNLTISKNRLTYVDVVADVRNAGFRNPLEKYWIWVDGTVRFGNVLLGGVANMLPDDRLAADNANNFGPSYGVFFGTTGGFGIEVMMHEASHSLGAVQPSAPHSDRNGSRAHCWDDQDVMCYAAAAGAAYKPYVCSRVHFDCRHDDYFNPRPRRGSYLDTHWNLASPLNRFFASCAYAGGTLTVGTSGQDVDSTIRTAKRDWAPLAWRAHTIPWQCYGKPFALSGVVVPPDSYLLPVYTGFEDSLNAPLASAPLDIGVCFYRGSKLLRCYQSAEDEPSTISAQRRGVVPTGASSARVFVKHGVNVTYVLSVV